MKKRNWNKNREILKTIPNPSKDAYEIKMKVPELTFEGVRAQPDFAHLFITFYPSGSIFDFTKHRRVERACGPGAVFTDVPGRPGGVAATPRSAKPWPAHVVEVLPPNRRRSCGQQV